MDDAGRGSGAYRAGYVVRATAPSNPDAAPDALHVHRSGSADGCRRSRARRCLPDRFVVIGYFADPTTQALRASGAGVGAPIPDDLALAPDPVAAETSRHARRATGRLVVPDALKWMVDFDAAVRVGMAVRHAAHAAIRHAGFDRVVAIGVRAATPAAEAPAAVAGAARQTPRTATAARILRAGTPTNNTDSAASGWQPRHGCRRSCSRIEDAPPDLTPGAGPLGVSDGWRLGDLFGLGDEFVRVACPTRRAPTSRKRWR